MNVLGQGLRSAYAVNATDTSRPRLYSFWHF